MSSLGTAAPRFGVSFELIVFQPPDRINEGFIGLQGLSKMLAGVRILRDFGRDGNAGPAV